MCGIAGLVGTDDRQLVDRMVDAMAHRGPDDRGTIFNASDAVHLGMRRLAIVDPEHGKQPMSAADGTLWVVFNGEIFNAPQLRKELEAKWSEFSTNHSDTEVLLHLYAQEGEKMVERLSGMFAFVIYDRMRRVLFGARDHCGIKPLYWSQSAGKFAVASEIKALLTLPWIERAIDHQALSDYFSFQATPAPRTMFSSIRKLPAGCCFTYSLATKSLSIRPYWSVPVDGYKKHPLTDHPDEEPRLIRSAFERAVHGWSMSDVPIAHSLSGGADSPAVVAVSALHAQGGNPVHTFTLGFSDAPDLDERQHARVVAKKWGTQHHEIVLTADGLLQDLDAMIAALDEPYGGGLPSWFVFKEMGEHVKVAMTGSGGDELFGNYGKWLTQRSFGKWRRRVGTFLRHKGSPIDLVRFPHGALHYTYFTDRAKRHLLHPDTLRAVRPSAELVESLWRTSPSRDARDAVAFVDFHLQLPEEFLFMTDRFSMAHSIEARTPFLDKEFIETVFRVPPERRSPPGQLKGLFLQAVGDLLPDELHTLPKKGFVLPADRWLRTSLRPLVERLCAPEYIRRQGIFREQAVEAIVLPHLEEKENRAWELWMILFFQLWYDKYIG